MMIAIDGTLVSKGPGGVYGERMIGEYRVWDPYRSKLAALWYLDHSTDLPRDSVVLYLGAANGTTVSHVADYAEAVYAVEFAPHATQPQRYAPLLEPVDLVYQDVAQPNQAAIAIRHLPFLREGGEVILMLKTRSVDIRKSPEEVFADTCGELEDAGLSVVKSVWLLPYHADHAAIVCKRV